MLKTIGWMTVWTIGWGLATFAVANLADWLAVNGYV